MLPPDRAAAFPSDLQRTRPSRFTRDAGSRVPAPVIASARQPTQARTP